MKIRILERLGQLDVKHTLLTILLLAFILRAGYTLVGVPIRSLIDARPVMTDNYDALARDWLRTGTYIDQMRPPLYPAFLAAVFYLTDGGDIVAWLAQAALDTVTCGPAMRMCFARRFRLPFQWLAVLAVPNVEIYTQVGKGHA